MLSFRIKKKNTNENVADTTFNGLYSRDNLPNKIKDEAYVINLDEYTEV